MFEDILEERKLNSDLRYSLKTRDVPVFKFNKARTPAQIKDHVMTSDRVQFAIDQVISHLILVFFFHIMLYDNIMYQHTVRGHIWSRPSPAIKFCPSNRLL